MNDLALFLKEDIIRDEIKLRTEQELLIIKIKRRIAAVISLFVLIIGWVIIWMGSVYENDIQDYFLEMTGNTFIGDWSGTLVMTVVNYVIPWIISLVDKLENWDFASE